MVPAAALVKENVCAGVVVAVATDVVNKGDNAPEENDVTVPDPLPVLEELGPNISILNVPPAPLVLRIRPKVWPVAGGEAPAS
jgi:hypothetical protein